MELKGTVAIVAGGGGGIGAATARCLHAAGAKVLVCDLDQEKGKAVSNDLGDGAEFAATDVTDEASVQTALDAATRLGPLRIAVGAHGGGGGPRVLDRDNDPPSQASFTKVIDIFLNATYNIDRLAAAVIARSEPLDHGERGVIINTASIAAFDGTIGQSAYSAAKAGIVGMTLPLARDLAPLGIRAVTIAPGTFLTPPSETRIPSSWTPTGAPRCRSRSGWADPMNTLCSPSRSPRMSISTGRQSASTGPCGFTPRGGN
jgi:NAD(P)-dependent dehydrogenase (short-subunit alcohol dehydrogenase family)